MVTDDPVLITVVDHVDVAKVLSVLDLVLATDLNSLVDAIAGTVESSALSRVLDPEVLLVLAAIHFDERRAVATVETGMLT